MTNLVDRNMSDITLLISSTGGDIAAALSTYNFLRSLGIKLTTVNVGNTYSAALTVFLAGDRRLADTNTQFLIHAPSTSFNAGVSMSATDLADRIETLQHDIDRTRDIYLARTHLTKNQAEAMMGKVTFLDARKALEFAIITEIGHIVRPPATPLITMPISTVHGTIAPPPPTASPTPPSVPATLTAPARPATPR